MAKKEELTETQTKTVENANDNSNTSPLTNKKVRVVPITRNGGWLPEDHDGAFMYTGCIFETDLPIDVRRGELLSILTREEQRFFESELFLNDGDLSIYKKKDNFWHTFKVKLDKDSMTLDLSDPLDNLKYRILMVDPRVAPNWEDRYKIGSYKFALVDEEIETKQKVARANTKKEAYKFLGSIEESAEKMRDVLRIYGNDPGPSAKKSVMYVMLDNIIEDPKTLPILMNVIADPHFKMKLFIQDAISIKAIDKVDTRYYLAGGGDKVGSTLLETIDYLKDPLNQTVYLRIKNQIELSNS